MAATQYSDYYNNNTYQHIHHHHQSQPQNVYGYTTGQYDCKNLNVNDAYNYYNYNSPNNQWSQQHNAIPSAHQHHQTQPHYQHQHLNMLSNQINDDYTNYSHHGYNNIAAPTKPISSDIQHHTSTSIERDEHQPNLNCNQYADTKNDLYYGQLRASPCIGKINEAIAPPPSSSYPSSQLSESSKKRKIATTDDSPALRALLTKPVKRAKSSPYFYQSHGSISPASSTDNYTTNYQLPPVPVTADEQSVNLAAFRRSASKEGYEPSIDDIQQKSMALDGKYCAASLFAPSEATNSPMSSFMETISTPPTSPKDVSKNDESCDNLMWNGEQNGGS